MQDIYACALSVLEKTVFGAEMSYASAKSLPEKETFLSGREIERLGRFKLEKRRLEWQAGRLAAKKLMSAVLHIPACGLEVSYDEWHRPVCGGKLISISHSEGLAAAAYSGGRIIGVDIEIIKPRSSAWIRDYFFEDEVPGTDNDEAIKAWTRKEAVMKAIGTGLTVSAKDVNIAGDNPVFFGKALERFNIIGNPRIAIKTEKAGNWYVSVAVQAD